MERELGTLIADPAWLPYRYDVQQDTLTFIHLPREAQRKLVFIDPRFVGDAPLSQPIPIDQLYGRLPEPGPVHFIFHTAFCCSTLVARAFDIPGRSMGYKEPRVFFTFGEARGAGPLGAQAQRALGVVLDLFGRPLQPGETQIIKPTNAANLLVPDILQMRPNSKALLLHSDLDICLNSTAAKGMIGRSFGRHIMRQFSRQIPIANVPVADLIVLTDLQAAAHAWLMQMNMFARIAAEFGPGRVRTLNSDTLLARKAETLERLGDFFGVPHPPAFWDATAQGPVFAEHAKSPGLRYDDVARREAYDRMRAAHSNELDLTHEWAAKFATATGAPMTLGDTLLDAGH